MKHIVSITYSDPRHEFMSMKNRTKTTNYVVEARDNSEAQLRASSYFRSMGYKIHSSIIVEQKAEKPAAPAVLSEEVEQVEEGTFKYHVDKAIAAHKRGDAKKKEYHLDNAKTARYAMPTKDYAKNKDLLDKYKSMSEEVEQIDAQYIEEKLSVSDGVDKWIHDFVHSDNPKFEGKSKEERIQQALGAYYAAKRSGPANEDVDYKALEKPTVARVKSGETKLPPRTNYDIPPAMRAAKKEGQVSTAVSEKVEPSKILSSIKAAAKSKTFAKQSHPKIELDLSKENPAKESGPIVKEDSEEPGKKGANKEVKTTEKETEVAKAKEKVAKGKKNPVVLHPSKDNVPAVVMPFNPGTGMGSGA